MSPVEMVWLLVVLLLVLSQFLVLLLQLPQLLVVLPLPLQAAMAAIAGPLLVQQPLLLPERLQPRQPSNSTLPLCTKPLLPAAAVATTIVRNTSY